MKVYREGLKVIIEFEESDGLLGFTPEMRADTLLVTFQEMAKRTDKINEAFSGIPSVQEAVNATVDEIKERWEL